MKAQMKKCLIGFLAKKKCHEKNWLWKINLLFEKCFPSSILFDDFAKRKILKEMTPNLG